MLHYLHFIYIFDDSCSAHLETGKRFFNPPVYNSTYKTRIVPQHHTTPMHAVANTIFRGAQKIKGADLLATYHCTKH